MAENYSAEGLYELDTAIEKYIHNVAPRWSITIPHVAGLVKSEDSSLEAMLNNLYEVSKKLENKSDGIALNAKMSIYTFARETIANEIGSAQSVQATNAELTVIQGMLDSVDF